jgi:MFS family permease
MTVGDWGPGTAAFEERARKAGKQFVLAHSVVPVVALVAYIVFLVIDRDDLGTSIAPAIVIYALLVLLVVRWARRQGRRPGRWVAAASWSGGIAGFFLGSPLITVSGVFDDVAGSLNVGRILGVIVGTLAGGCLIGLFVARSLATRAKRTLLEPLDDAVIRSGVELPWQARGDRKLSLIIGTDRITLCGNYGEQRRFTMAHALAMVTEAGQVVDEQGRPALRVLAAGEEWIFPTDESDQILHALRERTGALRR